MMTGILGGRVSGLKRSSLPAFLFLTIDLLTFFKFIFWRKVFINAYQNVKVLDHIRCLICRCENNIHFLFGFSHQWVQSCSNRRVKSFSHRWVQSCSHRRVQSCSHRWVQSCSQQRVEICRHRRASQSFCIDAAKLWNGAPPSIKTATSLTEAKTLILNFVKSLPIQPMKDTEKTRTSLKEKGKIK